MKQPADTDQIFELAPMQRGMLFHHLSSERTGVDLEQIVCRLSEDLQVDTLLLAWKKVAARHGVLRTRFQWEDIDEPVQVVEQDLDLAIDYHDWRELDPATQRAHLDDYLREDRARGFDYARVPLMRLAVLRHAEAEYDLIWSFPHILLDGRSFPIVLGEVFEIYEAELQGRAASLSDRQRYSDHVDWISAQDWGSAETFWRQRLDGFSAATPLPAARVTDAPAEARGETQLRLTREVSDALRAFAERKGLSVNTLVQGAWAILLSRYAGERDIVFGATRACRGTGTDGARDAVGLFINTLPVRVDVDPEADVAGWLGELRERERAVYAHEHAPLMNVQTWSPSTAGKPLFDSIIVYDNWLLGSHMQALGGSWEKRYCELLEQASFPLVLYGYGESELLFKLAYDLPLYDGDTAARLLGNLGVLLQGIAEDSDRVVGSLPLLTEAERRRMLDEWNATDAPVPDAACIHELIEEQARRRPGETALVFEDEQLTYGQLDAKANQLARRLRALGVGPDVLVGVCVDRSVAMMVGVIGILKAGGAYLPLAPEYPSDRIAYMLGDAAAPLLLTQQHLSGHLGDHDARVFRLDADWHEVESEDDQPLEPSAGAANLAYVIYTSGSTGRPKGVMVEHGNVLNFFAGMDAEIPFDPPGSWLAVTSLSFDISVLELLWTLARGFKVVVHADQARVAHRLEAEAEAETAATHDGQTEAAGSQVTKEITFSLMYFASSEGTGKDNYRLLMQGAKFADERGFEAVWTPERHFHAFGGLYPNPSVTSAALAAVTERVKLRAGSVVVPNHHPVRVAEEWSLVDNLSGGRVGIAAASGWQPNDFVFCPQNYDDAKNVMVENLDVVRRLWRGDEISFPGPKGDVAVRTLPRPVQPELPVWITVAGNPETFRMAGEIGANILTHMLGQTVEEIEDHLRLYRQAWKAAGHPGEGGQVTLMLHTFIGDDVDEVRETVRQPMKDYLSSAVGLVRSMVGAWTAFKRRADGSSADVNLDMSSLTEEELDGLLDFSFERYFDSSALFGTPESCLPFVQSLIEIGVDEIACLVDFGVETEQALRHLEHLDQLRARAAKMEPPSLKSEGAPVAARAAAAGAAESGEHSIAAQLALHEVTHLQCTPSMASMLLLDPDARAGLSHVRTLLIGGEAFSGHLAQELRSTTTADIVNMYGPTETTIWSSTYRVDGGAETTVPIGRPIANTQLYVLGSGGRPVPVGVAGELYIGGRGVVRGYFERPELTAERFVPDPFSGESGARLYRTGDLARYRPDGTLEFLGRTDHQVKIRGQRIELGEIEAQLADHESLRDTVVMAREDVAGDQRLVAYVIPERERSVDESSLREYLRQHLPEWMVPTHFVELDEFPQTPNRKVDRKALPAPTTGAAGHMISYAAPESDVESRIAAIWQDVLHLPQVGRDDNFFDLGGHSLLAVKAHRLLLDEFGKDLRIIDLFRFPTLRSLAKHVAGDGSKPSLETSQKRAKTRRQSMSRRRAARSGARRGTEGPRR